MTDTATTALTPYGGKQVVATTITVKNTGDGLSQGMAIDPQELELGSKRYVVMECEVVEHQHGPLKGTEFLVLDQVLKAGTAALVDADLVADVLRRQAEKIDQARKAAELAKEAERGTRRIFLDDDQVAALQAAHDNGDHDGDLALVEGCPGCDERAAEQAAAAKAEAAAEGNVTPIGRKRAAKKAAAKKAAPRKRT